MSNQNIKPIKGLTPNTQDLCYVFCESKHGFQRSCGINPSQIKNQIIRFKYDSPIGIINDRINFEVYETKKIIYVCIDSRLIVQCSDLLNNFFERQENIKYIISSEVFENEFLHTKTLEIIDKILFFDKNNIVFDKLPESIKKMILDK